LVKSRPEGTKHKSKSPNKQKRKEEEKRKGGRVKLEIVLKNRYVGCIGWRKYKKLRPYNSPNRLQKNI
jgi:hypothetical protein